MLPSNMNIELPEQRPKIASKRHTEMSADRTRPPSSRVRPPSSRKTVIKHEPCSSTLSIFHDSYVYYFIIDYLAASLIKQIGKKKKKMIFF